MLNSPVQFYSCQSKFGIHLQVVINLSTSKENALINKQSQTMPHCPSLLFYSYLLLKYHSPKEFSKSKTLLDSLKNINSFNSNKLKMRLIKFGSNKKKKLFSLNHIFLQKKEKKSNMICKDFLKKRS